MAVTTPYTEKTDEQKAICEMVHQFADEQIIPNAEHYDHEDSFPEPIVEQMKELGLFGVTIPEEYGGMGLDLTTYAMIVEELSPGVDLHLGDRQHALHRLLSVDEVRHRGAEAEVPPADGHRRDPGGVLSLSEPECGSDVQAIKTHGEEAPGRRRLRDQRPEDVGHQRAR